ncbi:hydroxysqualene dehydroxylase HpnE [Scleromatobacter humisilvae]|uniref:Hydroxysqualene dehydroxylase HpnE n=1 Tax=Scleromatobacter humisilvae TaxID=2897159 RepID=A0A9X1YLQ1_9BURK|nr:hydroxysqualene dehydroxylase HpnE [Scleromatobacter humisilvae]MCK9687190.1 hydroxysqualene dehydroxylase HpnE [Scleromatobacter humisilvae]
MRVAVVGAGWAGLAAAVRATQAGHDVTVFETAGMPGGRARSDDDSDAATDNGQHILLGGYARTLALMREVGVDVERALLRVPLSVTYADGGGFALSRSGPRLLAAAGALAGARGFGIVDKLSAVAMSLAWRLRGFRCPPSMTVDELLRHAPTARVHRRLIEPLCVAALNTPSAEASAEVFLAVMRDSLFGARDASDLLLPQRPLAQLLPLPALAWLRARGADVRLRTRVDALERVEHRWRVGSDDLFDEAILATPAPEAARLTQTLAPAWSATAAALAHEPIVTIALTAPKRPWPAAMLALHSDDTSAPAQFAFKLGEQPADVDRVTLVVSAAGRWLQRGSDAVAAAAVLQYRQAFAIRDDEAVDVASVRADKRATFRCTAGVVRPAMAILPGLRAAADHVAGPYPATLESAVMAGETAAAALGG